jgi:histidine triad (HIT) family protein
MKLSCRPGRFLAGWIFTHMSFAIPVRRLHEADSLLAFHHPKPFHPFHVLLVPKKALPSLADLVQNVQRLVADYHLAAYRMVVNGGKYQDFQQLHFHLFSDMEPTCV